MTRTFPTLLVAASLLLFAACSSRLEPQRQWSASMRASPLREVQVEAEVARYRGRGSGVILHSSVEHGTFILTCGHVTCLGDEIRQKASLSEFAADVGKVTECSGATVGVRVHESSAGGRAAWKEWMGFQGDVIFSKHVIERWPFQKGQESMEFETGSLPDLSIIDIAVVHLRTGAEPLEDVEVLPAGTEIEPGWSQIRGISYFENRPYQADVVLLNDRLFGVDGEYCSGSGIYDAAGQLLGIYSFRSGLTSGAISIGDRDLPIKAFYYFVPIAMVRAELEPRGLGFLLE